MSLAERASDAPSAAPASTAAGRPAGRWGKILGWLFVVALLIGVALTAMRFVATTPPLDGTLNPDVSNPYGAQALAEVLRQQGVTVDVVRTRDELYSRMRDDTTLVMSDPYPLSDESVAALLNDSERTVVLSVSSRLLRLSGLGEPSPTRADTATPDCDIEYLSRVGEIAPDRLFTPSVGATGCFTAPDGSAAVLIESTLETVILVEGTRLFSNAHLADEGNAALALALLGQTGHVVWYVPNLDDGDHTADDPATLGALTPEWVTPALVLLAISALAAIAWRGRRFGPLVAESLPVTVRASETMHGRARLTAKAADAGHAANEIRTGTVLRLSRRLGLSARASAQEVADAASDRLRVPRGSLYDLLAGPPPQNDPDLIALARGLADLEAAVETAVRTERNDQ